MILYSGGLTAFRNAGRGSIVARSITLKVGTGVGTLFSQIGSGKEGIIGTRC
jgi:hypothetical protein